ncbi:Hsp70 protein-domain-containing protein [Suillus lakei]|nr:Hsp70 protein-domain-containing protein [Suillus lakei]
MQLLSHCDTVPTSKLQDTTAVISSDPRTLWRLREESLASEIFGGKLPIKLPHPEALATGAAAILSTDFSPRLNEILVLDVASLSLGIQTASGVVASDIFTTDNQSTFIFRVFEGDKEQAKDNNLLEIFELSDIPPAPRGVPQIEVTFEIDRNNILSVTAYDQNTRRMKMVTVSERMDLSHGSDDIRLISSYHSTWCITADASIQANKTLKVVYINLRSLISEGKLPWTLKTSEKASLKSVVKQAAEFLNTADMESPGVGQYVEMQRILGTASSSILRKHGTTSS